MNDAMARDRGFAHLAEFFALAAKAAADLTTPEQATRFERWRDTDGTKAGLLALGAPTPATCLGLRRADLTFSDLVEEIRDVRHDIAVLEDYERGAISHAEVRRDTLFDVTDLTLLREALTTLRAWRRDHLICT